MFPLSYYPPNYFPSNFFPKTGGGGGHGHTYAGRHYRIIHQLMLREYERGLRKIALRNIEALEERTSQTRAVWQSKFLAEQYHVMKKSAEAAYSLVLAEI